MTTNKILEIKSIENYKRGDIIRIEKREYEVMQMSGKYLILKCDGDYHLAKEKDNCKESVNVILG